MPEEADFEAMYAVRADPFDVATRWYERRKEAVLLACLTRSSYDLAWDCAAGTGHLALALGERCEQVLATDASVAAVGISAALTGSSAGVRCVVSALPSVPADARAADLTVSAEVLYYLEAADRAETLTALAHQRGELAAVHWRHHPHDAHLSGAEVTEELDAALAAGWDRVVRHEDQDFVLGVWRSRDVR